MKRRTLDQIKKELCKENACYVLITCKEPTEDGQMSVEMEYSGDQALASLLLKGAQYYVDESFIEEGRKVSISQEA